MIVFSIITATYNRANYLVRLYNSLKKQSFKSFEWIIIDDGSSDDTREIVKRFNTKMFSINYISTLNFGKHHAVNVGVNNACGMAVYIVDSDDYLKPGSLMIAYKMFASIQNDDKNRYCGICGLKETVCGKIIGTTFEGEILDSNTIISKNVITGDKAYILSTSVFKNYLYPYFDGERFLTDDVAFDRMSSDGYLIRFFNKSICVCEYLDDGLTCKYDSLLINNPKGWAFSIRNEYITKKISFKEFKEKSIFILLMKENLVLGVFQNI